ncbi:phage/plasmid primase, P4 family [Aerococcaceae bacterium NML190073]|nr:phage/plasmid primase, P4 family [Aerococcaceae bacterium NML190073]
MTIYTEKGFTSKSLKQIKDIDPFEWLANYPAEVIQRMQKVTPAEVEQVTNKLKKHAELRNLNLQYTDEDYVYLTQLEKKAKPKQVYFTSGYIEPNENGTVKRSNNSLIRRDLILIDYDDLTLSYDAFIQHVGRVLKAYNFIIYPTIKHTSKHARARLVVQPDRPLLEYEYMCVLDGLVEKLALPYDRSSFTWSQCQGVPVITPRNQEDALHVNRGGKYHVPLNIEPPKATQPTPHTDITTLSYEIAVQIMHQYVETDKENLYDYTHAVSALCVLAKAVQTNEIDYNTAIECAVILAMGNPEWEHNNQLKLNSEIVNDKLRTTYTFKRKFHDILFKPETMADLKRRLREVGEEWREEHTEVNDKGEIKEPPLMHALTCANILRKFAHFRLIGNKADKSPLFVYNLDTGVYEANETLISQLIKCVEYRYNPPIWKHVKEHLRTDVTLTSPLQDEALIPVNNGIYDLVSGQLLAFSPKYAITSKIVTNYNPDVQKPSFDVDEWFKSLACGDSEIQELLWQVINEAINPNYTRKKIGFLIGDGNNGKGTFQKLLTCLIGAQNVSTLKPMDFRGTDGTKFKLENLIGKVRNIGDDISSAYVDEVSNLMSIATGDPIPIEIKNGPTYDMALKLFCLFSGNDMPKMRNKSQGLYRRLLLVPFNADFNGEVENPLIKEKYVADKQVLEYVLYKAINLRFKKFIEPSAVKKVISEYKKENDYVVAYVDERYIEEGYHKLKLVPVPFIRQDLTDYLRANNIKHPVKHKLPTEILTILQEATDEEYECKPAKYNAGYISTLPWDIQQHVESSKAIRSIVKKE